MLNHHTALFALLSASTALLLAATALADKPPGAAITSQSVSLDFHSAPMEEVTRFYANLMQQNFIVSSEVAGKTITVYAPTPVSIDEAYAVFLTALSMNGLQLVATGNFYKIVAASGAALPDEMKPRRPNIAERNSMETRVLDVEHAPIGELQRVLRHLASKDATVLSDLRTSKIIIVEHPRHMLKLLKILDALDRPGQAARLHVYQPKHSDAVDLAQTLNALRGAR